MKPIMFSILGAPRTKKNHGRLVFAGRRRRPRILPSQAHEEWYGRALPQVCVARMRLTQEGRVLPISEPVNVQAKFYRERATGDATGYYQALGDLLERGGILENDVLIESWDGSRRLKDAVCPRIDVVITALAAEADPAFPRRL
jgi:hypothetical protein